MTLNKDYHIHTKLCKHARGEMYDYVESALDKGLGEIAFTDHITLPDKFDLAHRMREDELEGYCKSVQDLRSRYPEISILCGIEADYYDGFEDYLHRTLDQFPFDLVIMSVHFIKGWPANNWVFSYHFPERSLSQIYSDYLSALTRGIKTGLFDIVGHLDLIKSPDAPLLSQNLQEISDLLGLIKQNDITVEINTSGMRKQIGELFPAKALIEELIQRDIPITIGSDAHQPDQVGFYFDELAEYLKLFKHIRLVTFKNRQRKTYQAANL